MATTPTQPKQFIPSAAKWVSIICVSLWSTLSAFAQDVPSITGTWVARFNNGVDRVYRIAADGTVSSTDGGDSLNGTVKVENGQFVIEWPDGRIHRLSKLAETLIKVEAFASRATYDKGETRAVGTGRLDQPMTAPPPPPVAAMVQAATPALIAPKAPERSSAAMQPTPVAEEKPSAQNAKQLVLSKSWDTPMQGGTSTMEDLAKLFGSLAKPNVDLNGDDKLIVYEGVPYLAPINEAVAALKLNGRLPSKNPVVCPGFPRDSFFTYAFDGRFDGEFNRLYLIVDRADQLVGVELVAEAPKTVSKSIGREQGFRTYNFVLTRTKAVSTLIIRHQIALPHKESWQGSYSPDEIVPKPNRYNENWTVAQVNSILAQPDPKFTTKNSGLVLKEVSRWYVPKPIIELILTCVQKNGR